MFRTQALSASRSFGLSLRNATASGPPVRTVTSACTLMLVKTCLQKSARKSSTTVIGDEAGIDHLQHVVVFELAGARVITTAGLPRAFSCAFRSREALVIDAALSDEHFLAGQVVDRGDGGAPGPVTTTSLTSVRVGSEKATSFSRSGVTVTIAATMSTLPVGRAV